MNEKLSKHRAPYIALTLLLLLTAGGVILLMGRNLDTTGMIFTLPWDVCVLPFMAAFPVYIFTELISISAVGEEATLLPYPQAQHVRTVKISAIVSGVCVVAGIALLIAFGSNPRLSGMLSSVMTVPGLVVYCGLSLHQCLKKEEDDMVHTIAFLTFMFIVLLVEVVGIVTVFTLSPNFALLFLSFPLVCVCMTMAGRKEED